MKKDIGLIAVGCVFAVVVTFLIVNTIDRIAKKGYCEKT